MQIEIACDDLAAQQLRNVVEPDSGPRFIERNNLSGDAATWIVIATLAAQAVPHLLDFLVKWRELNRVRRIKIGDIEIENPSSEDVERLRERLGIADE